MDPQDNILGNSVIDFEPVEEQPSRACEKTNPQALKAIFDTSVTLSQIPTDMHPIICNYLKTPPFVLQNKLHVCLMREHYRSVMDRYKHVDKSTLPHPGMNYMKAMLCDFFKGVELTDKETFLLGVFTDIILLDNIFKFDAINASEAVTAIIKNYNPLVLWYDRDPAFFQWVFRKSSVADNETVQHRAITLNKPNLFENKIDYSHCRLQYEKDKTDPWAIELAPEVRRYPTLLDLLLALSELAGFKLDRMCINKEAGATTFVYPHFFPCCTKEELEQDARQRRQMFIEAHYAHLISS
jgi:hypothetical protein